ncbi:ATP-binding protein [Serratia fonticola]|uniref:ATP-binding protein n=1 Tax=Serratia fonticola TaxID=47917 RepID=UPI0015C58DD9|nr:ATP-binding protein [Serratia fonticola]MBC3380747.1 ATP-binding protein [Serratia fonticola]NYA39946.1 ATP-binding protein [Serratia fonticola]
MRVEFTKKTKDILAGRAGYQCSHPQCSIITIGPGEKEGETSSIGEASHIYSAAKNGPRGQSGLTEEQLKSPENGIWLCKVHARLIDTNNGIGFTASQLISWKKFHEEFIKHHQGRVFNKLHWISKLSIVDSPLFQDSISIEFAKITIIESNSNGAGKTAICEWLSSVSAINRLARWVDCEKLNIEIYLHTPEPHLIEVSVDSGRITYKVDQLDITSSPFPFTCYFFDFYYLQRKYNKTSDFFAEFINISPVLLRNLFDYACKNKKGILKSIRFATQEELEQDDENEKDIYCMIQGNDFYLPFESLCGSEKTRVLLEIIIASLNERSKYTPTLLFIEMNETFLSKEYFKPYIERLNSSETSFQTIVTTHSNILNECSLGFPRYELIKGSNTSILRKI